MKVFFKILITIILLAGAYLLVSQGLYTGIYRTPAATPFSGAKFYNPYSGLDSATVRLKANFHAHTCLDTRQDYTPGDYVSAYKQSGYHYAAISDHNIITENPNGAVRAYEHGYNFNNFHILMTGAGEVDYADVPLMFMPRHQMQGAIARLGAHQGVVLSVNHPERLRMVDESVFDNLSGFRYMEINPDGSTGAWDRALSAGRFVVALGSDDAHSVTNRQSWFQRCFTIVLAPNVDAIFKSLYRGENYVVTVSTELNNKGLHGAFPTLDRMTMNGDTLSVRFSENPTTIRFLGRLGETLKTFANTANASFVIPTSAPYVRVEADFSGDAEGEQVRIFTNPVVRTSNPAVVPATSTLPEEVVWLTWLNRVGWTLAMTLIILLIIPVWRHKKKVRKNFEDFMWGAGQRPYDLS